MEELTKYAFLEKKDYCPTRACMRTQMSRAPRRRDASHRNELNMGIFWFIIICFWFNTYIGHWAGSDLLVADQLGESSGKSRICDHRWHEDDDWVECQPCTMWCYGQSMNPVRFVALKHLLEWARCRGTIGVSLVVVRRVRYRWLGNLGRFRMSFVAIRCWF